jgi:hypothetical protein
MIVFFICPSSAGPLEYGERENKWSPVEISIRILLISSLIRVPERLIFMNSLLPESDEPAGSPPRLRIGPEVTYANQIGAPAQRSRSTVLLPLLSRLFAPTVRDAPPIPIRPETALDEGVRDTTHRNREPKKAELEIYSHEDQKFPLQQYFHQVPTVM